MEPEESSQLTPWARLIAAARRRHGAFHLRRCAEHGLNPHTVRNRARREGWGRPHPAVLYLPGSADSWWRTASAWLEYVGEDAALSHRAAAHAHGFLAKAPVLTEVLRANGKHVPTGRNLKVRTSRTLEPVDVVLASGLPCTSAERTMRDLARVLLPDPLRAFAIDGLRSGALAHADLDLAIGRLPPGESRHRLIAVRRDLADVRTDSPFAYEVLAATLELGIPIEGEFPWRCPDGRIIHHDGAVPAAWMSVECDGRGKYESGSSFTTDRVRWTQTSGRWRTVWVSWDRWKSKRRAVLADVERAVAESSPERAPAERAACGCARCRRWSAYSGRILGREPKTRAT